jgi:DNA-binding IclR family transcriptional regulator
MPGAQVPAAVNAARLLRLLAEERGAVGASTIARALALPRSTTYHLLAALEQEGFVVHLPEERRYSLGLGAFALSSGYLRQAPLTRLGAPVLASFVDRFGESAHLAVLQGREVVYVLEERARHRPRLVSDVGVRLPSHVTATGRALLAALPPAQLRALFPDASALARWEGAQPSDLRGLTALLRAVRQRGFAWEDGEVTAGLASVAIAVRDAAGWPIAALAVTFASERLGPDTWAETAEQLRPYADELQRRIGG